MKKLQKDGFYREYAKILYKCCDELIIKKNYKFVESKEDTHYLPHQCYKVE